MTIMATSNSVTGIASHKPISLPMTGKISIILLLITKPLQTETVKAVLGFKMD